MSEKHHVLIIDDDETLRESISDLFRLSGYDVVEASSGEQGLQRLQAGRPDIIISDLMLPGIDGIELRKRLLPTPEGSIPFIFISAKADVHSMLRDQGLEREIVVSKPFDSLELLRMVEEVLIRVPGDKITRGFPYGSQPFSSASRAASTRFCAPIF